MVGCALGLAVLAALSADRSQALKAHGAGPTAALTGGYHLALCVAAAVVGAAVVIARVVLRPATQSDGEPTHVIREVLDAV